MKYKMKRVFMKLVTCKVFFTILLVGCSNQGSNPLELEDTLTTQQRDETQHKTLDDLFVDVESILDGFGGMYYDLDGNLNVYMNHDRYNEEQVEEAIQSVFGEEILNFSAVDDEGVPITLSSQVKVIQGEYDASTLQDWRISLRNTVFSYEEFVFLDLDEKQNKINIGVTDLSLEGEIREGLRELEIPQEAVVVSETSPIEQTSVTLQDRLFYDVFYDGGIQIGIISGNKRCTLGFNVNFLGYGLGFITNSHCTAIEGGTENTAFYQNERYKDLIGTEAIDPLGFSGAGCQPGRVCRYSDSAFVKYSSGLSPSPQIMLTNHQMGIVFGSELDIFGSADVVGDAPHYPLVGQFMNKVGRTTGHTGGIVLSPSDPASFATSSSAIHSSCFDIAGPNNNSQGLLTLYCQYEVNGMAASGDSGSPVYTINSNVQGNRSVTLYGLVHSIVLSNNNFVFSPIQGVEADLGSFAVTGF